jgi:hypothetical protein
MQFHLHNGLILASIVLFDLLEIFEMIYSHVITGFFIILD